MYLPSLDTSAKLVFVKNKNIKSVNMIFINSLYHNTDTGLKGKIMGGKVGFLFSHTNMNSCP